MSKKKIEAKFDRSAKCTEVDRRGNRKYYADDWFANSHGIEGRAAIAAARSVCGECRFAVECLLGAVERGEKHGIWGGINMEIARERAFARRWAKQRTQKEARP